MQIERLKQQLAKTKVDVKRLKLRTQIDVTETAKVDVEVDID